MTKLKRMAVLVTVAAGLGVGAVAQAQDGLSRALQGCENTYNSQMRMVCNAPIRARNPRLQQQCFEELQGHRARCIANTQARYQNNAERRARFGNRN